MKTKSVGTKARPSFSNMYTLRRKGSISATYLEPHTHLKKGFLWVLYRTLALHTWPIEPFTKKHGSI